MSLLLEYEQQYSSLTAEITAQIGRLQFCRSSAEKRETCGRIERSLGDVDELLEQMELAVRELPTTGSEKQKYIGRLRSYRLDKEELKKALKQSTNDEFAVRDELFAGGENSDDQRQKLLDNTERLERSSRKLEQGYSVAIETERIGAEILSNLDSQRQTLTRSRDRLRETHQELGQSSQILSKMLFRVIQNRGVLALVGGLCLLIIVLAIYFSVRKHV